MVRDWFCLALVKDIDFLPDLESPPGPPNLGGEASLAASQLMHVNSLNGLQSPPNLGDLGSEKLFI
jgi:hypothetical protein